jgi:hypothetical protein
VHDRSDFIGRRIEREMPVVMGYLRKVRRHLEAAVRLSRSRCVIVISPNHMKSDARWRIHQTMVLLHLRIGRQVRCANLDAGAATSCQPRALIRERDCRAMRYAE